MSSVQNNERVIVAEKRVNPPEVIVPRPGYKIILSTAGQQLLREDPFVLELFDAYVQELRSPHHMFGQIRRSLGKPIQEAELCVVGDLPMLAKEFRTDLSFRKEPLEIMRHMEFLRLALENIDIGKLRVPKHYGLLVIEDEQTGKKKQILLMERAPGRSKRELDVRRSQSAEAQRESQQTYDQIIPMIRRAVAAFLKVDPAHFDIYELLGDLQEKNVIVDEQDPSVLWLIDQ